MGGSLQPQLMTVQDLFSSSILKVPDYQRAYAWEDKQWDDLWEDIREGMRTGTTHFMGTVVLMADEEPHRDSEGRSLRVFRVVDGQQRITTLCLLLIALHGHLQTDHEEIARGLWRDFMEHEDELPKLQLGSLNVDYYNTLVAVIREGHKELPLDQRSTNSRLRNAVKRYRDLITAWLEVEGDNSNLVNIVSYIRERLQVLRFVTDSRPLAIKTFQTVNDRGKELSLLDKTKSFLMFYITRYLNDDEEVFRTVEKTFGKVFDNYDNVKDLAFKFGVHYLVRPQFRFNEDEFLRYAYHYGANDFISRFSLQEGYEYSITPDRVFDSFVKDICRHLRQKPDNLRTFILGWCEDLIAVSSALQSMLQGIPEDAIYSRFFRFQGPSASVYPLLVGAKARGFLDEKMLDAISILDLRVYQVRGTDPKADLYRYAISKMKTSNYDTIYDNIIWFCQQFGSDHSLDSILRGHVYRQYFTKYILWQFATSGDLEVDDLDYDLFTDCEVEHVLPEDSSLFDINTFRFKSNEEYESTKDGFGNLSVLESALNKRARNKPPGEKARVYAKSKLSINRVLGTRILEDGFTRDRQSQRENDIVQFFKTHWPIPERTRGRN